MHQYGKGIKEVVIIASDQCYLIYLLKKRDQKLSRSASGQSGPIKYEINFWLKGPCKRFEVEHILCV